MKFLLLVLFVGVASANLLYENTGEWRLYAIAANNPEKFAENGPKRLFYRHLYCETQDCNNIAFTFWMKNHGVCKLASAGGRKDPDSNNYHTELSGDNSYTFCYQSANALVVCVHNTDASGRKTAIVQAVVKPGHDLTEEESNMFTQMVEAHGIPKENISYVKSEDTCPK